MNEEECETKKKWSTLYYKGESYIRFPRSCLTCDYLITCEEGWADETKERD